MKIWVLYSVWYKKYQPQPQEKLRDLLFNVCIILQTS